MEAQAASQLAPELLYAHLLRSGSQLNAFLQCVRRCAFEPGRAWMENFYEQLLAAAPSTPSPQAAAEAAAFNAARLGLPRPEEPEEPHDRF